MLQEAGCDVVLEELGGRNLPSPQLTKAVTCLDSGDILVIIGLEHLPLNYNRFQALEEKIRLASATLRCVLDDCVLGDHATPMDLSAAAAFYRSLDRLHHYYQVPDLHFHGGAPAEMDPWIHEREGD